MDKIKKKNSLLGIQAIIFDFDGTLAELNIDFSFMRKKIYELMIEYGIEEELIQEKYLLEIIDEVYKILNENKPYIANEFYQKAHQAIYQIEMESAEKGRLFTNTKVVLEDLRKRGIKVGIITRNCEEAVRRLFPDIGDYCDAFVSRNAVKKVKPHPDHLNHVLEALKIQGEKALVVGDHLIDIEAGKRLGMKAIGVLTGRIKREEFEEAGADGVLEDISEIFKSDGVW